MSAAAEHPAHHDHHEADGRENDPVCGMSVDPATAPHHAAHRGRHYFFCGDCCKERFIAEPAKFLAPKPGSKTPGASLWTCPMHPEIAQPGPGSCPLCGMALEPVLSSATDAADPELASMTRRLRLSAAVSLPLLVIGMFGQRFPGIVWIQLALA